MKKDKSDARRVEAMLMRKICCHLESKNSKITGLVGKRVEEGLLLPHNAWQPKESRMERASPLWLSIKCQMSDASERRLLGHERVEKGWSCVLSETRLERKMRNGPLQGKRNGRKSVLVFFRFFVELVSL